MNLGKMDLKVLKEFQGVLVLMVSLGCLATKVQQVQLVRQDFQALKACWEIKALKAMKDHQVGTCLSKELCYYPGPNCSKVG